jgi:hypothetical protein
MMQKKSHYGFAQQSSLRYLKFAYEPFLDSTAAISVINSTRIVQMINSDVLLFTNITLSLFIEAYPSNSYSMKTWKRAIILHKNQQNLLFMTDGNHF